MPERDDVLGLDRTRRAVMNGIGASVGGLSLLGLSSSGSANDEVDIEWSINNTVEGDANVNISLEVGYFGSTLTQRFIDGSWRERWAHDFEVGFTAKDTFYGTNNIWDQRFDTRFYGGTERNTLPTAGSAAWPSPPGGNWGEVLEVILEESITSLSTVADFTKTASEVIDAYQTEDFDVVEMDQLEFDANYRGLTREECSHSVAFTADQQPDTDGMIDILSSAQDSLNGDVGAVAYLYPESGDLPKPPQYSDTTTPYSDMFDEMSEEELAEYEIQRIPYEQRKDRIPSHQKPSDRDVPKRPVYTTSFEPDVDFDVKNGRIINSEVYKY